MTLSHVEIKKMCGVNIPKSKPHFSPRIRERERERERETWSFEGLLWGIRI